jgi:hypothetical protein
VVQSGLAEFAAEVPGLDVLDDIPADDGFLRAELMVVTPGKETMYTLATANIRMHRKSRK